MHGRQKTEVGRNDVLNLEMSEILKTTLKGFNWIHFQFAEGSDLLLNAIILVGSMLQVIA